MDEEKDQLLEEVLYLIEKGDLEALQSFVAKHHLNLRSMDSQNFYPFVCLCPLIQNPDAAISMLSYLISTGIDPMKSKQSFVLPESAIQFGSLPILKFLIDQHRLSISYRSKREENLLHIAVYANETPTIQYLLQSQININEGDNVKMTPLHYAVISMNLPLVKLLVERGADATIKNLDGNSPLDLAMKLKLPTIAAYLKKEEKAEKLKYTLYYKGKIVQKSVTHKMPDSINFQQLLTTSKYKKMQDPWQLKQIKTLKSALGFQYGYVFEDAFYKLYKKLHTNCYASREVYLKQACKAIEAYEGVFATQPPILGALKVIREKMK